MNKPDNLNIYNQVRAVPKEALKEIQAGRLKGKSDINPMWRIRTLTEQFGPCGIGWKYVITKQWIEEGANGEKAAFVNIDLYIKVDGEWSEPIPGTGGSMFVANEKNGPFVSDECYKMALTDAISVSCKALGFAADVYWQADATKYSPNGQNRAGNTNGRASGQTPPTGQNEGSTAGEKPITEAQMKKITTLCGQLLINDVQGKELLKERYNKTARKDLTSKEASDFITYLLNRITQQKAS